MSTRDVVVFDIDGVIGIPDPERIALWKPNGETDWDKFYSCDFMKDKFNPQIVALANSLAWRGFRIVVSTARSERVRDQTSRWLERVLVGGYSELIMRGVKDFRPAHIIKPINLFNEGLLPSNVIMAIDDDEAVVASMSRLGYTALHYTAPEGK